MKTADYRITTSDPGDGHALEIVMEGDLSLKNAGMIFKALRSLKTSSGAVTLRLRNVEKLDITTLQTIRVFKNLYSEEGKTFKVEPELAEEAQSLLRKSGFNTIL